MEKWESRASSAASSSRSQTVGFEQTQRAQTVADCQWGLDRATAYEGAIFYYEAYLAYQGLHEEAIEEEMCKARASPKPPKNTSSTLPFTSPASSAKG